MKEKIRWLFSNWHISYVMSFLFFVWYLETDGEVKEMLSRAVAHHDTVLGWVLAELVVRKKIWSKPNMAIIPKQPEQ